MQPCNYPLKQKEKNMSKRVGIIVGVGVLCGLGGRILPRSPIWTHGQFAQTEKRGPNPKAKHVMTKRRDGD